MAEPNETAGPQLTWTSIVLTAGVACVIIGGAYAIVENEFTHVRQSSDVAFVDVSKQIAANTADIAKMREEYLTLREHRAFEEAQQASLTAMRARLTVLEAEEKDIISHSAHTPVEAREIDQLSAKLDALILSMQNQINDINRQIAASLISRDDTNNSTRNHQQLLPK